MPQHILLLFHIFERNFLHIVLTLGLSRTFFEKNDFFLPSRPWLKHFIPLHFRVAEKDCAAEIRGKSTKKKKQVRKNMAKCPSVSKKDAVVQSSCNLKSATHSDRKNKGRAQGVRK